MFIAGNLSELISYYVELGLRFGTEIHKNMDEDCLFHLKPPIFYLFVYQR